MDPIKHVTIPLLFIFVLKGELQLTEVFLVVLGSTTPDFDVFFEEHRSYFHSIFFLIPFIFASFYLKSEYLWYFTYGLCFHFLLDLFSGVLPLFYPFKKLGIGIKIAGKIEIRSLPKIKIESKLSSAYPSKSKGEYIAFSSDSFILAVLTLILLLFKFFKP